MPEKANKGPVRTVKAPEKPKTAPKRSKETTSKLLAFVIVLLLFYLVISLLIAGFIYYSFNDTAKNTEIYSLRLVYGEKTLHTMNAATANNQYGLYVPFSYLTEIGSFGLAGDGDEITLFIIGTDNRIKCTRNSSLITINDNPVRISAPILSNDDGTDYLIPVVLLENYINGIDVNYDPDRMICYVSSEIGKTDVALKLLLPEPMEKSYFPESYKTYNPTNTDN